MAKNEKVRKRKKTQDYFGPIEEQAVNDFLATDDQQVRDFIYITYLKNPLNKMIDSIIRRYKLYRKNTSFEELHMDVLGHLMTKAHKFENSRGKKAYSYYGTICKNYILGLLIKDDKKIKTIASYEDIYSQIENDEAYSYTIDEDHQHHLTEFIEEITTEIKHQIESDSIKNKDKLTDNEKKLGLALIEILTNWPNITKNMEGGKKYNKISLLSTIRESTLLTTKDIRHAMRRFKKLYKLLKENRIENGFL